jgi:hypothetical protein
MVIKVLMSLFATEEELGYDPMVIQEPTGTYLFRPQYGEADRFFRTEQSLSEYRSNNVTGRMARVWHVAEYSSPPSPPLSLSAALLTPSLPLFPGHLHCSPRILPIPLRCRHHMYISSLATWSRNSKISQKWKSQFSRVPPFTITKNGEIDDHTDRFPDTLCRIFHRRHPYCLWLK